MDSVAPDSALTRSFELASDGASITFSISDENAVLDTVTVTPTANGSRYVYEVAISALLNALSETELEVGGVGYRIISGEYTDNFNRTKIETYEYLVWHSSLDQHVNCAGTHGQARKIMHTSADLDRLTDQTDQNFILAMTTAWRRMCNLTFVSDVLGQPSLSKMTAEDWNDLDPIFVQRLIRCQLVEANVIAGGDPVGDRRRAGLMSDSNGESAQFFRPTKPIDLPITRQAALELKGMLDWGMRVGR